MVRNSGAMCDGLGSCLSTHLDVGGLGLAPDGSSAATGFSVTPLLHKMVQCKHCGC